jgi:ABC-2 type transport system permease protein
MRKLLILSRALGKGFVRDRASLFFSVVFPLMFLVLFGGVFNVGTLKTSLIEIGKVPLFNAQIKQEYKDAVRFKQYDSRSKAIAQVRKGKYVAAVEQSGNQLVVHYTANDAVQAGSAQGIISAIVGQQNQQASGSPSRLVQAGSPCAALGWLTALTPELAILDWSMRAV